MIFTWREGHPDGFASNGSPGWRIGMGVSDVLVAEGSAHVRGFGLALLADLRGGRYDGDLPGAAKNA